MNNSEKNEFRFYALTVSFTVTLISRVLFQIVEFLVALFSHKSFFYVVQLALILGYVVACVYILKEVVIGPVILMFLSVLSIFIHIGSFPLLVLVDILLIALSDRVLLMLGSRPRVKVKSIIEEKIRSSGALTKPSKSKIHI